MKKHILVLLSCLTLVLTNQALHADVIVDYSAVPVNQTSSPFLNNAGMQFLNTTEFDLDSVEILMGGFNPGSVGDFQVIEFDAGMGDLTGTVMGTIVGITFGSQPFNSFADAITVDLTSLNLTLQAGTVYGFVIDGVNIIGAGTSGGGVDTDSNINSLNNGNGAGVFGNSNADFEIPFIANGTTAIPEPSTLGFLALAFAGFACRSRRRK